MLHSITRGGDMTKMMFGVHNYIPRRLKEYSRLEQLGDIFRTSERLWVFKVMPNTTELDIYQMWEKNMFDMKR